MIRFLQMNLFHRYFLPMLLCAFLSLNLIQCKSKKDESAAKNPTEKPLKQKDESPTKTPLNAVSTQQVVYVLEIKGPITPTSMEKLQQAIEFVENPAPQDKQIQTKQDVQALVILLDTPGGLMSSMDEMIQSIIASRVPVVTFVYPAGATSGSAGVYIMYASHIAAMAPATNIGSATPVQMSPIASDAGEEGESDIKEKAGTNDKENMKRKILNHALAKIRSLAEYRNRNSKFAEDTITRAANATSTEAFKLNAIDLIAVDMQELLQKIHNKRVCQGNIKDKCQILNVKDAKVIYIKNNWRNSILNLITHPNVSSILMLLGIIGLMTEIRNPGLIFPGVVGLISLFLGLYANQVIGSNLTGAVLLIFSLLLFLLEVFITSYGLLSFGGLVCMILGGVMLARNPVAVESGAVFFILASTTFSALLMFGMSVIALRSQLFPGYPDQLVIFEGETGVVIKAIGADNGMIRVRGELWQAKRDATESGEISISEEVKVIGRDGLTLFVKRA